MLAAVGDDCAREQRSTVVELAADHAAFPAALQVLSAAAWTQIEARDAVPTRAGGHRG